MLPLRMGGAVATTRVTVSLPTDLVAKLKTEAGERSMSAFVATLIQEHLEEAELERLWKAYVDDVGVTADDVATADRVLDELLADPATDAA
jgi:hypothetical protein